MGFISRLVRHLCPGRNPGSVLTPAMVIAHAPPLPAMLFAAQIGLWLEVLTRLGQTPRLVEKRMFVTAKVHPPGSPADPLSPLDGALLAPVRLEWTRVVLTWKGHWWDTEHRCWIPEEPYGEPGKLADAMEALLPASLLPSGLVSNVRPDRPLSRTEAKGYRLDPVYRAFPPTCQWIDEAVSSLSRVSEAVCFRGRLDDVLPAAPSGHAPRL